MRLMTKAIAEKLYQNDQHVVETGDSPEHAVVKYFDPQSAATWYVTTGTPLIDEQATDDIDNADDWHLFGFATLGDARCAEYGYTLLSTLENHVGPLKLAIERDLGFSPSHHPMKEIVATIKAGGHV
jgi:hypothetical protein